MLTNSEQNDPNQILPKQGFCMIVSNSHTRILMKGIMFANDIAVWKWWYMPIYMLVFLQYFSLNLHHLKDSILYETVAIKHNI